VLGIAAQLWDFRQRHSMTTDGRGGSLKADLNPRFVEALMGFPSGHVTRNLEPSEMPLFQHAPK
jgi:hypothetical protein